MSKANAAKKIEPRKPISREASLDPALKGQPKKVVEPDSMVGRTVVFTLDSPVEVTMPPKRDGQKAKTRTVRQVDAIVLKEHKDLTLDLKVPMPGSGQIEIVENAIGTLGVYRAPSEEEAEARAERMKAAKPEAPAAPPT